MMKNFSPHLQNSFPILMDGAMGTLLYERGLPKNLPPDIWNLEKPEEIKKVHQEYFEAGAQILFTNTFGASRVRLAVFDLEKKLEMINQKAVLLCRSIASKKAYVAGSLGPIGSRDKPFEKLSFDEAADIYQEQMVCLLNAGVDLLVLETQFLEKEIKVASVVAEDLCKNKIPVMLLMTINQEGKLSDGVDPVSLLPFLEEAHVPILGLNCSFGPESIYPVLKKIKDYPHKFYLAAKPNAGLPGGRGDSQIAPAQSFTAWGNHFVDLGIHFIGGCCQTTPEMILGLANIIASQPR